jgi:hypothetical protein
MPTEIRHLTFSHDEVLEALVNYNKMAREKLAAGSIVGWQLVQLGDWFANVSIRERDRDDPQTMVFKPEVVAAALIRYCVVKGIPLPRRGDKSIAPVGDNLCLTIRIGPGGTTEDGGKTSSAA